MLELAQDIKKLVSEVERLKREMNEQAVEA